MIIITFISRDKSTGFVDLQDDWPLLSIVSRAKKKKLIRYKFIILSKDINPSPISIESFTIK